MTSSARGSLVWPAMILAGLALGGYAVAAWPDTTSTAKSHAVPVTASVDTDSARELTAVAGAPDRSDLFVYELRSTLLLDTIISAPQPVDAH